MGTTWGGIQITGHYMHNKFNNAVPKGDRDGSSQWIMEVLAGAIYGGSGEATSANCEPSSWSTPQQIISGCQTDSSSAGEDRLFRVLAFNEVTGVFQYADSTVNRSTKNSLGSSTGTLIDVKAVDKWNIADLVEFHQGSTNPVFITTTRQSGDTDSPLHDMNLPINNSPFPRTRNPTRLNPGQSQFLQDLQARGTPAPGSRPIKIGDDRQPDMGKLDMDGFGKSRFGPSSFLPMQNGKGGGGGGMSIPGFRG